MKKIFVVVIAATTLLSIHVAAQNPGSDAKAGDRRGGRSHGHRGTAVGSVQRHRLVLRDRPGIRARRAVASVQDHKIYDVGELHRASDEAGAGAHR